MDSIALSRTRLLPAVWHRAVGIVVALGLVLVAGGAALPAGAGTGALAQVVVSEWNPASPQAEQAVEHLGGDVGEPLTIVDGFTATIPEDRLAALRAAPGVRNVALNRPVELEAAYGEGSGVASAVYTDVVQAPQAWDAGVDGSGIGVAVIDTGINATGDLAGKVLHAVDFTAEANNVDSFGHGTFVAGLIAGQGSASGGGVRGVAPGAHLVSVKIAGADGNTDLVRLLAALEWVATWKDAYGIRVVNLSLGSKSNQSYRTDPLNVAVERVWRSGIVVVTSAGNYGTEAGAITKPGDDPLVITAGALDDRTTVTPADDTVAGFSSNGPTVPDGIAKPDLVAPGRSVVSTRAAGSTIDLAYPQARIGGAYFKGSGTSFSAPIVAGAAALVIDQTWALNPDQVKQRLVSTARPLPDVAVTAQGRGVLDAFAAVMSTDLSPANAGVVPAGGKRDMLGTGGPGPLGSSWAGSSWAGSSWAGSSWAGSQWNGSSWAGSSWAGSSWAGSSWAGSSWAGSSWAGSSWAGSSWAGSSWAGSSWAGSSWATFSWASSWDDNSSITSGA